MDAIILKCNSSIQTSRTYAAVYNILKGNKAIQTVLDIHLYRLKNMYGIYPSLSKKAFDYQIDQLISSGHLLLIDGNKIKSTEKGEELLKKYEKTSIFHYFDGSHYIGISGLFRDRLMLSIQTFTNKQVKNNHFIPVVDKLEIYNWVRQYYRKYKNDITRILTGLYEELYLLLENLTGEEASIFADRLTGFNHYGSSIYQLHNKYDLPIYDIPLILEGITQNLLSKIIKEEMQYPMLNEFINDLNRSNFLTSSAKKTFQLYRKGFLASDIASIRNLKINTIHDHLVEIALYDTDFPYQSYVNQTEMKVILQAIHLAKSYKLKDIKTLIDTEITYFQIRLVMAVMRNSH